MEVADTSRLLCFLQGREGIFKLVDKVTINTFICYRGAYEKSTTGSDGL